MQWPGGGGCLGPITPDHNRVSRGSLSAARMAAPVYAVGSPHPLLSPQAIGRIGGICGTRHCKAKYSIMFAQQLWECANLAGVETMPGTTKPTGGLLPRCHLTRGFTTRSLSRTRGITACSFVTCFVPFFFGRKSTVARYFWHQNNFWKITEAISKVFLSVTFTNLQFLGSYFCRTVTVKLLAT